MNKICKKCCAPIQAELISCGGFCFGAFHPACVGLQTEAVDVWSRHSNFWWMCNACGKALNSMRTDISMLSRCATQLPASHAKTECPRKTQENVDQEIAELKKQVDCINQTLAEISSPRETSVNSAPIAQSSPNQSMQVKRGSKPVTCQISNSRSTLNASSEKHWLFFTKIKNTTTEMDVLDLVIDSLGISNSDDVIVKKLIPHWRDASTMPYVSFKVGLDVKYKRVADRSSTWPQGLCFREFVENVSLWEPQSRILH